MAIIIKYVPLQTHRTLKRIIFNKNCHKIKLTWRADDKNFIFSDIQNA